MYPPFTIDNFPRVSCDRDTQDELMYANPRTKLHGPRPIRLFPAFKTGAHVFGSDYNLDDKSESMFVFCPPLPPPALCLYLL